MEHPDEMAISPQRGSQEGHLRSMLPSAPADTTLDNQTTNDLQPSGVLNRHAMKGRYSLQDLLVHSDSDEQNAGFDHGQVGSDDPVTLGMINVAIARSLFDSFVLVLNPFISQLDPELHDFAYVRHRSAFLLTAVLTASAKAFHPVLYNKLYQHSQSLLMSVFRHGHKSVEVVQAILILTYWKEPHDNRVWTNVGFAIRIGMELDWHRLRGDATQSLQNDKPDKERRETRNLERTWLVLFVYDRSISLQTGKPYMIECDPLVESIRTWTQHELAIGNDRLLGALVTLRLETSAAFSLMIPRSRETSRAQSLAFRPLFSVLNRQIGAWEASWSKTVTSSTSLEEENCHEFLICFYGCHLRLQLSSLQIQENLNPKSSTSPDLESLWVAYTSALRMLRLIPRHAAHLTFAQDSVHIMLAYSAAFLEKVFAIFKSFSLWYTQYNGHRLTSSKLLRLAPPSFGQDLDEEVLVALRGAATTYAGFEGESGSTCALQARFLNKIVTRLIKTQNNEGVRAAGEPRLSSVEASTIHMQDASTSGSGGFDFVFPDSGNWDYIFTSAGLDADTEVFLA